MTRYHFRLIAEAIHEWGADFEKDHGPQVAELVTTKLAEHFADKISSTNWSFDRDRFVRAAVTGKDTRS